MHLFTDMFLVIQEKDKGKKYSSLLHTDLINLRVIELDSVNAGIILNLLYLCFVSHGPVLISILFFLMLHSPVLIC